MTLSYNVQWVQKYERIKGVCYFINGNLLVEFALMTFNNICVKLPVPHQYRGMINNDIFLCLLIWHLFESIQNCCKINLPTCVQNVRLMWNVEVDMGWGVFIYCFGNNAFFPNENAFVLQVFLLVWHTGWTSACKGSKQVSRAFPKTDQTTERRQWESTSCQQLLDLSTAIGNVVTGCC